MDIDRTVAALREQHADDPEALDHAIAAAVTEWQAGEMFRRPKEPA